MKTLTEEETATLPQELCVVKTNLPTSIFS